MVPTVALVTLVIPPTFWQALDSVVLRIQCAWCQVVSQEGSLNAPTSHSMCPRCSARLEAELDAADRKQAA